MKLSVVIPVYNHGTTLVRMMESLVHQLKDDCEIILVDDSSYDQSQKIIKNYCRSYPSIVSAYGKKHGGIGSALNVGLSKAVGEYVVFLNPEDYVDSSFYLELKSVIEKDCFDIIKYQRHYVYQNKIRFLKEHTTFEASGVETFQKLQKIGVSFELLGLYVFRRKFLLENNLTFLPKSDFEIFGFISYQLMKAKSVWAMEKGLYYYSVVDKQTKNIDFLLSYFDYLLPIATTTLEKQVNDRYVCYLCGILVKQATLLEGSEQKAMIREVNNRKIMALHRKHSSFFEHLRLRLVVNIKIH